MSNAPNCPISHSQQKLESRRQPIGVDIATIPAAHDLRSVITAINAISHVVQHITRGVPQINNTYGVSINFKSQPPDREPPPQYNRMTWREIDRDYKDNEIVNPDDEDQKIEIKTIERVIWQEDTTEKRVVYNGRHHPNYR